MSLLVSDEILGIFVYLLNADGKYPVQGFDKLQLRSQMQLSGEEKTFFNFLFHFWNLHQISNIFKKKMIFLANVFPKLQTVKILVRPLFKNGHFRKRFDSQHEKASQILAKSP